MKIKKPHQKRCGLTSAKAKLYYKSNLIPCAKGNWSE